MGPYNVELKPGIERYIRAIPDAVTAYEVLRAIQELQTNPYDPPAQAIEDLDNTRILDVRWHRLFYRIDEGQKLVVVYDLSRVPVPGA